MSRTDLIAVAVVTALALPWPAFGEPAELASQEVARRSLARGDELRAAGRCEAAITSWRGGLAEVAHWAFLLRIGDCYERLGRHGEAIPYLLRGVDLGGDELDDEQRARVHASIERCRAEQPALLVVASPVGNATVSVDGAPAGTTPILEPMEIEPGEHVVTLSRQGFGAAERRITARRGETSHLSMDLENLRDREGGSASRMSPLWGSLLIAIGAGLAGGGSYLAAIDGQRIDPESYRGIDSLGPGIGLAALGGGLLVGGIVLLAVRPMARSSSPE